MGLDEEHIYILEGRAGMGWAAGIGTDVNMAVGFHLLIYQIATRNVSWKSLARIATKSQKH